MTPDSNGILMLEDTDPISPFQVLINTMQAGTSSVLTPLIADAYDSGWVNVTISATFAAGSPAPQVRRIGKVVHLRGVMSNTGMSASTAHAIATIPSGYRPVGSTHVFTYAGTTNPNGGGRLQVTTSGVVTLTTQATLGGSYYLYGINWTVD